MAKIPKTRRVPKGKTLAEKYPGWTFESFLLPEDRDVSKAVPWESLLPDEKEAVTRKMLKNTSEVMSEYYSRPENADKLERFVNASKAILERQEE